MPAILVENPTSVSFRWRQRALRIGRVFAVVYLAHLVVLLRLENFSLYHAAHDWTPPPADIHAQDVELHTADGTRLHGWWCVPPGWQPTDGAVLYCHGNGGNVSHRAHGVSRWQTEMGQAVLVFDYPGYGRSEGVPSEAGCNAAAEAAHDWLVRQAHVPPERLLIFGGSLGGGPATHLAAEHPHRALVLACTFTSVPDLAQDRYFWTPARWLVRNQFDNRANLARCRGPVFVAHGTDDGLIPYAHGEGLYAAAREPKAFLRMEGFHHSEFPAPEFYPALRAFLAGVEKSAPPPATSSAN